MRRYETLERRHDDAPMNTEQTVIVVLITVALAAANLVLIADFLSR